MFNSTKLLNFTSAISRLENLHLSLPQDQSNKDKFSDLTTSCEFLRTLCKNLSSEPGLDNNKLYILGVHITHTIDIYREKIAESRKLAAGHHDSLSEDDEKTYSNFLKELNKLKGEINYTVVSNKVFTPQTMADASIDYYERFKNNKLGELTERSQKPRIETSQEWANVKDKADKEEKKESFLDKIGIMFSGGKERLTAKARSLTNQINDILKAEIEFEKKIAKIEKALADSKLETGILIPQAYQKHCNILRARAYTIAAFDAFHKNKIGINLLSEILKTYSSADKSVDKNLNDKSKQVERAVGEYEISYERFYTALQTKMKDDADNRGQLLPGLLESVKKEIEAYKSEQAKLSQGIEKFKFWKNPLRNNLAQKISYLESNSKAIEDDLQKEKDFYANAQNQTKKYNKNMTPWLNLMFRNNGTHAEKHSSRSFFPGG